MGCVFGKEVSSSGPPSSEIVVEKKRDKDSGNNDTGGGVAAAAAVGEVENAVVKKGDKEGGARPRGERRRSKANPRSSNPGKNIHGEQVAAGWPAWLSAVAGEAINGWIPRRADTFEKIDKVKTNDFF